MKYSPTANIDYGTPNWKNEWYQAIGANRRIRIRFYDFLASQVYGQLQVVAVPLPGWPYWAPVPYPSICYPVILAHFPELIALVHQAITIKGYDSMIARYKPSAPKQIQLKLQ